MLLADAVLAKTASDDADAAYVSSSADLDVSAELSDKVAVTAKFVFHNRASPLRVALAVGCFVAEMVTKKMVGLVEFCLLLKHTKLVNNFFVCPQVGATMQQRYDRTDAVVCAVAVNISAFRLPACGASVVVSTVEQSVFDCLTGSGSADHVDCNDLVDIVKTITGRDFNVVADDSLKRARARAMGLCCAPTSSIMRLVASRAERFGIKWTAGEIPANAGPAAGAAAAAAPVAGLGPAARADTALADTAPAVAPLADAALADAGPAPKQGWFFFEFLSPPIKLDVSS